MCSKVYTDMPFRNWARASLRPFLNRRSSLNSFIRLWVVAKIRRLPLSERLNISPGRRDVRK